MITTAQIQPVIGQDGNVLGDGGEKIGKIQQVFLDDETGNPEWVTVKTGSFGSAESFVPLAQASLSGMDIQVPYAKSTVKDAPRVDTDDHLSRDQEAELYGFYGLQYSTDSSDSGLPSGEARHDAEQDDHGTPAQAHDAVPATEGHDTSGPSTDDAMTLSEEQLHVGTEQVTTGKARLRKYVVTENVTQTVPVSHEEVRLEREPITEANRGAAHSGGDITEEEHEITLNEERVTVSKEAVPVERVKLGTETVTGEEQVDEQVRKEQIELDDSALPENRSAKR